MGKAIVQIIDLGKIRKKRLVKGKHNALVAMVMLLVIASCKNSDTLFQENSKNWDAYGDANWSFSDNELIGEISGEVGFVMTKQSYSDFILELEFNPDNTINSGIFVRCQNTEISEVDCFEMNIWDSNPNQDYRTGAIVGRTNPLEFVETEGKWNTYKIKAEANHIQVWVNDKLTSDENFGELKAGFIGLQASGNGIIKFRNIVVTPL
ncbi:DUF1080 domain-containing protein [Allomuricauda sp. F6463D]|uniref:3-keto-disaccharide hydrolase n=1 Tax=Allomuricauda sp. F6463D TaxID=2926409 RepID=UPI001FF57A7F|nr:DUF1080 domain-containing protein [Muricauda sp. F6463D]MCK0160561.1 DUF1080 domain-containing protein [Muricauda sp. F6463D]